jgi:hypothetical protein
VNVSCDVRLIWEAAGLDVISIVLPPFRNIRCFSFVKLMYLDIF